MRLMLTNVTASPILFFSLMLTSFAKKKYLTDQLFSTKDVADDDS